MATHVATGPGIQYESACWAGVEGDDLVHVTRAFAWPGRTLCGKKVVKFIVSAIPRPKVVDCEECIEAGAYNVEEPEAGYQAAVHGAWIHHPA